MEEVERMKFKNGEQCVLNISTTNNDDLVFIGYHDDDCVVFNVAQGEYQRQPVDSIKKLSPKTRTEYVKVEFEHAWEAVKAFEDGEELFITQAAGGYSLINDAASVLHCREYTSVYRKVEKEIDTREENGKAIYRLMCKLEDEHEIDGYHNSWGELRDEWKEIYKELAIQVGYVAPE